MPEPIVFLPGFMCDARLFEAQMIALGREHVVMAAPVWTAERIEEMASELLFQLPAKFALVGHCFGGMVALEILRRAPERVTRIALMSMTPMAESAQYAGLREPRIVAARSGRMADALAGDLPNEALAPGFSRTAVQAQFIEMAEDLGAEAYYRQTRALQRRRDQQAMLRGINIPILILSGLYDTIYPPKRHEFMAELIPFAKLVVLDGAGHLPPLEAPVQVTDALQDWLRQPLVLR